MIAFIRGKVASYGTDWLVVDNNGIGFQMYYPHCDNVHLNEDIHVHTYMHFTESDTTLFGFETTEEKELFLRLISVKGLGPKTAMNMLMKAGYNNIVKSIESGDVTSLKKMPGIGAKSASQIVLDLKGKLVETTVTTKAKNDKTYPPEINDALEGLKGLGYKANELGGAAEAMMQKPGLTTKEYLQLGLRFMAKQKLGG